MAAAKTSNAAFDERERIATAEEAVRRAEAERRRKHQADVAALLDSLVEEQARADRLRSFNAALREGRLTGHARQLLEWSEARLAALERALSAQALEERLIAADLFGATGSDD